MEESYMHVLNPSVMSNSLRPYVYYYIKEASLKKATYYMIQSIWHSGKSKQWRKKPDQWYPGAGEEGDEEVGHRGFLELWKHSV